MESLFTSSFTVAMEHAYHTALVNGETHPMAEPAVRLTDLGLLRGYAVFEFLKVLDGVPVYLPEHLSRLRTSMQGLGIPKFDHDLLQNEVYRLIALNEMQRGAVRILITGGEAQDGYTMAWPARYLTPHTLPQPQPEVYQKGISIACVEYCRDLPGIKHTGYAKGVQLQSWLKARGADDVLYHHQGLISETPRSNLFIVSGQGVLQTPKQDMLAGITRGHVLRAARLLGLSVEEKAITTTELLAASEAFLTSTTKAVLPICKVNDQVVGQGVPGPIGQRLLTALEEMDADYLRKAKGAS